MRAPRKLPRFPTHYYPDKECHPCPTCGSTPFHIETHIRENLVIDYVFACDECGVEWTETISH